MKNKKLLKTVLCVTSGIGFATSIPFMTTACGSSSTKTSILPDEVYKYDPNDSTILTGFTDEFLADTSKYSQYDTMKIPASVTSIADNAFYNASTDVTTIPAFITKLTFADGSNCSVINNNAFDGCSSLTSVSFPSGLTTIRSSAFSNSGLTSVDLSNCMNLSSIYQNSFTDCFSIKDIKIDNDYYHVEQLGPKGKVVIRGKSGTTSWNDSSIVVGNLACGDIEIPASVTSVGYQAFYCCASLTSVIFPTTNLTLIDEFAFNSCSSLNYIAWNLPDNYSNIIDLSQYAFFGISSKGKVKSLNTSIASSQELLDWLKTINNIFDNWIIA